MCAEMICVNNTHRHSLGVQGACWLTSESKRAKDLFELVEARNPTELVGILAKIKRKCSVLTELQPRRTDANSK